MAFLGLQKFWEPEAVFVAATTGGADPQLQFFENFPGHLGAGYRALSYQGTLSLHAVNIPASISFNNVAVLGSLSLDGGDSLRVSVSMGLYSLNDSTLSLANSASFVHTGETHATGSTYISWFSFATSATQNITPGTWYFGLMGSSRTNIFHVSKISLYGNSSINPGNAIPGGFLMGRMTASTENMPASIATSDLDITGSDAIRQPYIILTA